MSTVTELDDLAYGLLPSSHQRRIMVLAPRTLSDAPTGLHYTCAVLQRRYVGGLFVSAAADSVELPRLIGQFVDAGCWPRAAHLYRPEEVPRIAAAAGRIAELMDADTAELCHCPDRQAGHGRLDVAELLAVGATDVLGAVDPFAVRAAACVAGAVNRLLGEDLLAVPTLAQAPVRADADPRTGTFQELDPSELRSLLDDGARQLATECDDRLAVLADALAVLDVEPMPLPDSPLFA